MAAEICCHCGVMRKKEFAPLEGHGKYAPVVEYSSIFNRKFTYKYPDGFNSEICLNNKKDKIE